MKTFGYTLLAATLLFTSCKTSQLPENETPEIILTNETGSGPELHLAFQRGEKHNHPLMAVWIESESGEYLQSLFVAKSIAKGIFGHGDASTGKWLPGEIRRPAALPVWSHSRGVQEADGLFVPTSKTPMPDAYTGATPKNSFILNTKLDQAIQQKFYIVFEINQTWDWNEYWHNNRYPDNDHYKASCQPSLVYKALVDMNDGMDEYTLKVVGRGHHAGEDGNIYEDLETMSTALDITRGITVTLLP